jgi:hypothetical protein
MSVGNAVSSLFSYYGQEQEQETYFERPNFFGESSLIEDEESAEEYAGRNRPVRYEGMDIDDELLLVDGVPIAESVSIAPSHADHGEELRRSGRRTVRPNYKAIGKPSAIKPRTRRPWLN